MKSPAPSRSLIARRSAFTLVELLTVIAIIGMLAGLVLGLSGYANRKAARSKAFAEMEKLENALEEFRVQNGSYPDGQPNPTAPTSMTNPVFFASFSNALPGDFDFSEIHQTDPWGNAYIYQKVSRFSYRLTSTGPSVLDSSDDISTEKDNQ